MHVIHVGPYADRERREPAVLLDVWPTLVEVPAAVRAAGMRVSVVQAAAHDALVRRHGVDFHFIAVRDTHSGATRLARATCSLQPDVIHVNGLRFPLHVRALRRTLPRVPIVAQDHADRAPTGMRARVERSLSAGLDAVMFTSVEQAQPFLRSGALRRDVPVAAVPEASTHFSPGDPLAARAAAGIHGDPCIVWVGRLHEIKDPLTALAAFDLALDALPNARLWCAFGDAPLLRDVQAFIDSRPRLAAAVTLIGTVPRDGVEQLLRGADIFFASSRREGSGFALIEALACGAVPVVSDIPAFRALTVGGSVGALFPVGDASAAAQVLVEMARAQPDRAHVRAHFDEHLSPAVLGRQLRRTYEDAAARRRRLRVCLIVPGGVDQSGTHRVIPCVLALIERLARTTELHVLAVRQEPREMSYELLGARVHCVPRGSRNAALRWLVKTRDEFGFDVLHALWMHPQGTAAAAAGLLLRRPVLLHINGGDLADLPDIGFGGRASRTGRVRLRLARSGATRITTPSASMARTARELGITAEQLTLGVALDRWPVRAPRPRIAGVPLRLLSVGSINRVKDHITLVRAVSLLRSQGVDVVLDIVGEDTLRGGPARLADELCLGDVIRFHGFLPHDALRPRFEDADVLVVSSRHEADPIAALEAAVAGLAVVGTDVGHLSEWSPDAALVCQPADAAALAGLIAKVACDEPLRLRLAAAAQARALDCDADRAAARVLAIYHEIVGHARN